MEKPTLAETPAHMQERQQRVTTREFIELLEEAGAQLIVHEGKVILRGPNSITAPVIIEALRRRRGEVIEVLKERDFRRYLDILSSPQTTQSQDGPQPPPAWMAEDSRYKDQAWAEWWRAFDRQESARRNRGHEGVPNE